MHINKLKPYHSKGQFQTFKDNFTEETFHFQKQVVDVNPKNYFNKVNDLTENNFETPEEQKLEEKPEDKESTEELPPPKRGRGSPRKTDKQTEKKSFPTLRDIDECYQLRSIGNQSLNQSEEIECTEGEEWINEINRRDIERRVRIMQSQITPRAQKQQIRINYLSQINPFITE